MNEDAPGGKAEGKLVRCAKSNMAAMGAGLKRRQGRRLAVWIGGVGTPLTQADVLKNPRLVLAASEVAPPRPKWRHRGRLPSRPSEPPVAKRDAVERVVGGPPKAAEAS